MRLDQPTITDYTNAGHAHSSAALGSFVPLVVISVSQATHGFSVGDVLYKLSSSGYAKAKADNVTTAEAAGIVITVPDASNFTLLVSGHHTALSSLTAGSLYYLSDATAGALTDTEPTAVGSFSKPLVVATSTTSGIVFVGRTLPTATGTGQRVQATAPALVTPTLGVASASALAVATTTDSASTGAADDVATTGTSFIRFTNASLTSISSFANPSDGKYLVIMNRVGAAVTIKNDSGGTATNRIRTGTGADLSLANDVSMLLQYDNTTTRWNVIGNYLGGAPSGSAGGDLTGTYPNPTIAASRTFTTPTIAGLLDLTGASGGQIKFPAAVNASSNANTLDDYEEGTWTPVDNSGGGLDMGASAGFYTKIGNVVHVNAYIVYPSTSDANAASLGGLPFTCVAGSGHNGGVLAYATASNIFYLFISANSTTFIPYNNVGAQVQNLTLTTATIFFQATYFTS